MRPSPLLFFLLLACTANPGGDPALHSLRGVPDALAAEALETRRLQTGMGRLVVVAGTYAEVHPPRRVFIGNGEERSRWPHRQLRGDLVINGVHVGFLEHGQAMVIDLPPGTYVLSWMLRDVLTDLPASRAFARDVVLALGAGTTAAYAADAIDATRVRADLLSHALGGPVARPKGRIVTTLTRSEELASLLARAQVVLSPQAAALAAIPGASLAGR